MMDAILTILMYADPYRSYGERFSFDISDTLREEVDKALIALSDGCLRDAEEIVRRLLLLIEMEEEFDSIMDVAEEKGSKGLVWAFDMHSSNLKKMVEQFLKAGFAANITTSIIFSNIVSYMEAPDASQMWRDAVRMKVVDPNELRFGRGYQRNVVNAITILMQDVISTAYNEALRLDAQEEGFEWYEIFRGSTYDCELCDSYTGKRIPITERVLPIHPRCMCYAVYHKDEE